MADNIRKELRVISNGESILSKMESEGQLNKLSRTMEEIIKDETLFAIWGKLTRAFEAEEKTAWIGSAVVNQDQCVDIQGEPGQHNQESYWAGIQVANGAGEY